MILDSFRQDIRVGLRVLLKDKLFLLLSILVLALGIGGAMTQFTVVNAMVFSPMPIPRVSIAAKANQGAARKRRTARITSCMGGSLASTFVPGSRFRGRPWR